MTPRPDPSSYLKDPHHHLKSQTNPDKECHEEEARPPSPEHPNPHVNPHLQAKPDLRQDRNAHTNTPHDEPLLHLNAPSPIKAKKNSTQLRWDITKTLNFVRFY